MVAQARVPGDAGLVIDSIPYPLDDTKGAEPPHIMKVVKTQPGDANQEFERVILNNAGGWGISRYERAGGYDYGDTANLHKRLSWLPGAAVTSRLGALNAPTDPGGFAEYWDGTAANRRLIIVAGAAVYEVQSNGTITETSLAALVGSGKARIAKRYKAPTAMSAPKMFISVQNGGATDYLIQRTAANTYSEITGTKRAVAVATVKDSNGDDVLARVTESGKLNLTTADTDPDAGASWAAAEYSIGETSALVNDIVQQGRSIIIGRADGAYTFDSLTNAVPITRGMDQTPSDDNFKWFKDFNGLVLAPTAAGIVYIDGLDWDVCGPVSSNPDARSLRGVETAVSDQAGSFLYAAVYYSSTSYIFLGTYRRDEGSGHGPFVWHGPFASVSGKVVDLRVSTVFGTKLWLLTSAAFSTIELNDDFSPKTDATSGNIYLPEGIFDMDGGPGVIKDFRKVEFIAPAAKPFSSTNAWTLALETTPGSGTYTAVDGGSTGAGDGVVASRFWSTETSGKRLRGRIQYSGNSGGTAELEAIVVRGTMRPETADEHTFRLLVKDGERTPRGVRTAKSAKSVYDTLRGLVDSGRKTVITYGETSFQGRVTDVRYVPVQPGVGMSPRRAISVTVRRVVLA